MEAGYAKGRREDRLPLRGSTAAALAAYLAGRLPNAKAFPLPHYPKGAEMLRADLASAGIEYEDEAGRQADFHALRHTFITNLAAAGVHPKQAMDLARHPDINLTLARYSHTVLADRAQAVAALPDLSAAPEEEAMRATGTPDAYPHGVLKRMAHSVPSFGAPGCNSAQEDAAKGG